MKIAYCLSGTVGGIQDKAGEKQAGSIIVAALSSNQLFNMIDCSNVDFFIHSWDVHIEAFLKTIYNPKKYIFEPQIIFDIPQHLENNMRSQSVYSRLYSNKRVIELKNQYEIENKFVYDFVIVTRFDLFWINFIKLESINQNKFNVVDSPENQLFINTGKFVGDIDDLVFISSSKNANKIFNLYDYLNSYTLIPQKGQIYIHFLIKHHLKQVKLWEELYCPIISWRPPTLNKIENSHVTLVRWLPDLFNKIIIKNKIS